MKRHRGFTLIEMTIALMISIALLGSAAYGYRAYIQREAVDIYAGQLVRVKVGLDKLTSDHYADLVSGAVVPGFADPYHPTIAELIAARYLETGTPDKGIMGGDFQLEVSRFPTGCTPPLCDLVTKVQGSVPVTTPGTTQPDESTASQVVRKLGGDGGTSKTGTTDRFTSLGGATWAPGSNPVNIEAVVAVRGGYGSSGWGQFVRLDGSTAQTGTQVGDWKVQSKLVAGGDVTSGGNVVALGAVQGSLVTSSGNVTAAGNVQAVGAVTGDSVVGNTQVQSNGALNAVGALAVGGNASLGGNLDVASAITAGGDISTSSGTVAAAKVSTTGRIESGEYIRIGGSAVNGAACSPSGIVGLGSTGTLLVCHLGTWGASGAMRFAPINDTRNLPSGAQTTVVLAGYGTGTPQMLFGFSRSFGGSNCEGSIWARWRSATGVVLNWTMIAGFNLGNGNDGGSGMTAGSSFGLPIFTGVEYVDFFGGGCNGGTVALYGIAMV